MKLQSGLPEVANFRIVGSTNGDHRNGRHWLRLLDFVFALTCFLLPISVAPSARVMLLQLSTGLMFSVGIWLSSSRLVGQSAVRPGLMIDSVAKPLQLLTMTCGVFAAGLLFFENAHPVIQLQSILVCLYLFYLGLSRKIAFRAFELNTEVARLTLDRSTELTSFQKGRRVFDIFFAVLICPFIALMILVISCISFCIFRETVFFSQKRVGLNGKCFSIYKFRTYFSGSKKQSWWLRLLRKTGLDELPQILNIFIGNMSFVGPRPELPANIRSTADWQTRASILPGITGYWQISPFRDQPIANHIEYDLLYVADRNIWRDTTVLLLTPFFCWSRKA